MNQSQKPLDNKKLREAIATAIDKDGLTKTTFGPNATPATSFIAPSILGHTDNVETYPYNPERAKQLLSEAGYKPDQLKLKLTMWAQNAQVTMSEVIQANLKEIGIDVAIEALESAAFSAALQGGKIQIGLATNSNTYGDPDTIYKPVFSTNAPSPNYAFVNNPRIDELVTRGKEITDPQEREKIYIEAQQILADEAMVYPLCHENETMASRKEVKNFVLNPTTEHRFAAVSF
jgi:peptide/nickel transport system substrate-binding protein